MSSNQVSRRDVDGEGFDRFAVGKWNPISEFTYQEISRLAAVYWERKQVPKAQILQEMFLARYAEKAPLKSLALAMQWNDRHKGDFSKSINHERISSVGNGKLDLRIHVYHGWSRINARKAWEHLKGIANDPAAGIKWCRENFPPGFKVESSADSEIVSALQSWSIHHTIEAESWMEQELFSEETKLAQEFLLLGL